MREILERLAFPAMEWARMHGVLGSDLRDRLFFLKHLPYLLRFEGGRLLFWLGHDVSRVTLDSPKICLDSGVHYKNRLSY